VLMPDTEENQIRYPQHGGQEAGAGFPITRMVGVSCVIPGFLSGRDVYHL